MGRIVRSSSPHIRPRYTRGAVRRATRGGLRFTGAVAVLGFLGMPAYGQTAPLQLGSPLAASTPLDGARELLDARRPAEADALLRRYLQTNETSAPARYLLGSALVLENKPRDALAEFTHAASLQTPSAWDLIQVSRAYVLLADWTDAARWLERALAMNPGDAEAWYDLGRVRYSDQRFAEAMDCFRRVLALEPRSVRAENNLGLALEGLNRTDEAVAAYRQALLWQADAPNPSEQPMINLATVLIHRGEGAEALPLLERAAEVAPHNAAIEEPIREQLGHLYLQQGKLPQAATAFERALALTPNSAALHFLLGQTYRRMGQKAKADAQFQQSSAIAGVHSTPGSH